MERYKVFDPVQLCKTLTLAQMTMILCAANINNKPLKDRLEKPKSYNSSSSTGSSTMDIIRNFRGKRASEMNPEEYIRQFGSVDMASNQQINMMLARLDNNKT